MRRLGALVGLWVLLLAPGVRALAPEDLAGRWTAAQEGALSGFRLQPAGAGRFRVAVTFADGKRWELECVATGRPGVYAASSPTGLLDWLFARRRGEPLQGAPLFWARVAEDEQALVLYRLVITADGHFRLHRLALRRDGEALAYDLRILAHDEPTRRLAGRLVR